MRTTTPTKRFGAAALLVAAVLLLATGCARSVAQEAPAPPAGLEYVPPAPGTYRLPTIQAAVDGTVLPTDGREHRLFDYLGDKVVILSFIYTRCNVANACPLATATMYRVQRRLAQDPEIGDDVRLVTLSFDPEKDTPENMARYAGYAGVDTPEEARRWVFLTTPSPEALQPILDGYGQYVVREIGENGAYTGKFSHVIKVFLIDRERRVRNIYSSDYLHPDVLFNDVATLLMEVPAASAAG